MCWDEICLAVFQQETARLRAYPGLQQKSDKLMMILKALCDLGIFLRDIYFTRNRIEGSF